LIQLDELNVSKSGEVDTMRTPRLLHLLTLVGSVSVLFVATPDRSQADESKSPTEALNRSSRSPAATAAQRPAGWTFEEWIKETPPRLRDQFTPRHPAPYPVQMQPGSYLDKDWAAMIDSVWGSGLSWSEHATLWQFTWDAVDTGFASFFGLDSAIWDTVWNRYWPEVQDTVSKGRLAAIANHAMWVLEEQHTGMYDLDVLFTQPEPGVPLLLTGGVAINDPLGAALTPLPDSSLLVYKTVASHPLGLVPGDLVLGYDGVPWKDIYPYLLDTVELPYAASYIPGNTEASRTHGLLTACGANWHLFDSVDVVKYSTGDTMRLSTAPLIGQDFSLYATEQLEIPGVPIIDVTSGDVTTWGVVDGTNIGYIYSWGWFPRSDSALIVDEWLRALDSLQNVYDVCGLIIDIRTNFGTNFDFTQILDYFFADTLDLVGFDRRAPGGGHFDMEPGTGFVSVLDFDLSINGDPNTYWDKPIAILTGPSAGSGGDMFPLLLSFHPGVKVFGKTSASAFSVRGGSSTSPPGWNYVRNCGIMYLSSDSGNYINRRPFPNPTDFPWVDFEEVWLTQDGVFNGRDDVVEAAMAWFESLDGDCDGVLNELDNCPLAYNPAQEDLDSNGVGDSCECNVVVVANTGDVNTDGSITSADIIYLVNYVFKGGAPPMPCEAAGDVNCNGSVTSADIIYLVSYVFKGGAAPCDVCTLIPGTWTCP